ncbi:MAG: UDP-N-acetylmuramoyl-tripeptide--D-alanyl-D-alanine ligase, partial [Gammaproteobacteria bacterium]|nr:UDP-N-acetylmuramoyl-tripeptide--D-alanyl-D-alanine ligase [Gammaproteobacteria bacterium]
SFGITNAADVIATDISADGQGSSFTLQLRDKTIDVRLSLPGRHNVRNACGAAAIAFSLGLAPEQIQAGLESVRPVSGRLQPLPGINGSTLFDDSYNANPLSVAAAAEFLASLEGPAWMVLGDMGELGDDSRQLHEDVGRAVKQAGVNRLFATGELCQNAVHAFGADAAWFDSVESLIASLRELVTADANVLVKGSRFMRMERVVEALRADEPGEES